MAKVEAKVASNKNKVFYQIKKIKVKKTYINLALTFTFIIASILGANTLIRNNKDSIILKLPSLRETIPRD